jgi:hypothetical protein
MLEDQAKGAQKQADILACRAWNERMRLIGGPACPSPSIAVALNAGHPFLEVVCKGCRTHAAIELSKLRRSPSSEVHTLEGALVCRRCADPGGRRRSRSTVVALHQVRPPYFETWWTDQERDRN